MASSISPEHNPTPTLVENTQPESDGADITKRSTDNQARSSPRACSERLAVYLRAVVQVVLESESASAGGEGEGSSSVITPLQIYLDEAVPGWDKSNMSGKALNNMVHFHCYRKPISR